MNHGSVWGHAGEVGWEMDTLDGLKMLKYVYITHLEDDFI